MLVLDANILIRAVLGKGARGILAQYGDRFDFVAPDTVFQEARIRLPRVLDRRKLPPEGFMKYFESLDDIVRQLPHASYVAHEAVARQRIERRDKDDWPVLACALANDCLDRRHRLLRLRRRNLDNRSRRNLPRNLHAPAKLTPF